MDRAVTAPHRPVAIAIGSNLGDRRAAIAFAVDRLSRVLSDLIISTIIETEPEDATARSCPRIRCTSTPLSPERRRSAPARCSASCWPSSATSDASGPTPAPRARSTSTSSCSDDDIIDEPDLQVPHPRFRGRFFVLGPLAELAPELRDPVTGLRVGELLVRLLQRRVSVGARSWELELDKEKGPGA